MAENVSELKIDPTLSTASFRNNSNETDTLENLLKIFQLKSIFF
jgi:hypothetical protein